MLCLESAYGNKESNLVFARKVCRYYAMMGVTAMASHVYFTQFLHEEFASERKMGIELGLEVASLCTAVIFAKYEGQDVMSSAGVQAALAHHKEQNRIIRFELFTQSGEFIMPITEEQFFS